MEGWGLEKIGDRGLAGGGDWKITWFEDVGNGGIKELVELGI